MLTTTALLAFGLGKIGTTILAIIVVAALAALIKPVFRSISNGDFKTLLTIIGAVILAGVGIYAVLNFLDPGSSTATAIGQGVGQGVQGVAQGGVSNL